MEISKDLDHDDDETINMREEIEIQRKNWAGAYSCSVVPNNTAIM